MHFEEESWPTLGRSQRQFQGTLTMSNWIDFQIQIEKLRMRANGINAKEFDKMVLDLVATVPAFRHHDEGFAVSE